jgi:pyruvate dehydrogenase E2 component (dihydrolipoamide acetyltransferase)
VEEHQIVLEIETDKAVVEIPSPRSGRIIEIRRKEGDVVKVGEPLMTIGEEGEAAEKKPESVSVVGVLPEEGEVLATPRVRSLAREHGIRLEGIRGSGPGGSITEEDVLKAVRDAGRTEDEHGPVERIPIRGTRRTIARNLMTSQRMTVSVTGMDEADVTDLWELREKEKGLLLQKGVHLTFLPFFIKAVQHSLIEHPLLNASVDEERNEILVKRYYNIGIAVDTPDGLMVPVIKGVDRKTILELAEAVQELSERARKRKITLQEMRGSTFTISNYGHFGGTFATPVINYPDVAILGTGRITERPWVKDGKIVTRKILPLSLTFDHRVTDGVDAAKFLTKVRGYLEDPASLFIESG